MIDFEVRLSLVEEGDGEDAASFCLQDTIPRLYNV